MISLSDPSVFPVAGNVVYGRMMFYLESAPSTAVHWTFIDGTGTTHDATPIFEPAYRVFDLPLHPAPATATFYARHGDLFAYACWALWLAHFALGVRRRTISSPGQDRDRAA